MVLEYHLPAMHSPAAGAAPSTGTGIGNDAHALPPALEQEEGLCLHASWEDTNLFLRSRLEEIGQVELAAGSLLIGRVGKADRVEFNFAVHGALETRGVLVEVVLAVDYLEDAARAGQPQRDA